MRPPCLFLLLLLIGSTAAVAAEVAVDPDGSVFAVITRKGGIAKGLAHDHLVVAGRHETSLTFDPADPLGTRFALRFQATELVVDDPELQARWYPRLRELGIQEEPFPEIPAGKRDKIRRAMLGPKQLDAESFAEISARVDSVEPGDPSSPFPFVVALVLTVHGTSVTHNVQARYSLDGETLTVEAFGTFRFTDFGIKPYSAALGAVKNLDGFHVYTKLTGRVDATEPAPADR